MPGHYEMDVSPCLAWADALVERWGPARALRIVSCERSHYPGVSCVCGWLDDPPMPDPVAVPTD